MRCVLVISPAIMICPFYVGYAVVNDETVDSPSLVISEIPTCQADYYCYPHKIHLLCLLDVKS